MQTFMRLVKITDFTNIDYIVRNYGSLCMVLDYLYFVDIMHITRIKYIFILLSYLEMHVFYSYSIIPIMCVSLKLMHN